METTGDKDRTRTWESIRAKFMQMVENNNKYQTGTPEKPTVTFLAAQVIFCTREHLLKCPSMQVNEKIMTLCVAQDASDPESDAQLESLSTHLVSDSRSPSSSALVSEARSTPSTPRLGPRRDRSHVSAVMDLIATSMKDAAETRAEARKSMEALLTMVGAQTAALNALLQTNLGRQA